MSRRFTMLLALGGLLLTTLACSLAGPEAAPPPVESAPSPTVGAPTVAAPAAQPSAVPPTQVQVEIPTAVPTVAGEVLPTDTATSTTTPTSTATATATPKPQQVTATPTKKPASAGPLTVEYQAVEIKRNPNNQAVMTLKVTARGGGGGYVYYHDDQKQAGATFDVLGSCGRPFVHTIKVTSADGQTATAQYFIAGDCPTPTPTPKP